MIALSAAVARGRAPVTALVALLVAAALGALLAISGTPWFLVAIIGAGLILAALVARPEAATLLFVGVFYVNLPVVATRFHGVPESVALMTPLLLLFPAVAYVVFRREPVITPPVLGLMLAYLLVLVLSGMVSTNVQATTSWVGGFVTEGIILYVLVTNGVRTVPMLRATIWTLLLAGMTMGMVSVFQEVTQTYENSYLGFAQTRYTPGFEDEDASAVEIDARPRLGGPIGSKNRYAQVMLVLLPFALFAAINARTRPRQVLAIAAGAFIVAGIALTFSRGAGVAMVGMLGMLVALRYVRLWHAVALAIVASAAIWVVAPQYVDRLSSVVAVSSLVTGEQDEVDNAILGRATSNLAALNVFLDHPVLGVGPGQYFGEFSQEYANELNLRSFQTNRRAHNLYLEIAADTGLVGLGIFLAIVAITLRGLWRCRAYWLSRRREYANWATALFVSISGYMISATFLHLSYVRYFWFLIALASVAVWILNREQRDRPDTAK